MLCLFSVGTEIAVSVRNSDISQPVNCILLLTLTGLGIKSDQISRSVVSDSLRPPESQHARPLCPSWSSLRLTSIESVMPSSHLILCCPLLLLPPIPLSIRVFSNESSLRMRWPKYWSFSFSIISSKEIPGLISTSWQINGEKLEIVTDFIFLGSKITG